MTSVLHYRDPIAYRSDFMSMSTSNYASPHTMDSLKKAPSYDGHSSESESRKNMSGGKKRPSRAGTRSVTTLTAAQLERKRANDREAQRAIRQRTKDHIDTLERQVRDLTVQLESSSSSKMIDLMRRNEELEQENAMLRARLGHAASTLGVPEHNTGMSWPFVFFLSFFVLSSFVFRAQIKISLLGQADSLFFAFWCLGPHPSCAADPLLLRACCTTLVVNAVGFDVGSLTFVSCLGDVQLLQRPLLPHVLAKRERFIVFVKHM